MADDGVSLSIATRTPAVVLSTLAERGALRGLAVRGATLEEVGMTAADNGIDKKIRFGHRVKRASWSSPDARWTVEAERRTG